MKNEKPTSGFSREMAEGDKTDWSRLYATTDEQVEIAVAADPDEAFMVVDWSKATLVTADRKKTMTIRLDSDVLEFYRGLGRGYQTTINAVLRSYMDHAKT